MFFLLDLSWTFFLLKFQTPEQEVTCDALFKEVVLKNSVIKGYHIYKVKHPTTNSATRLTVEKEFSNPRNPSACLVWIPPLSDMSTDLHDMYTDPKRYLKVSDVAGLPVGRVPHGFFMEKGCVISSEPIWMNFPPWPQVHEKGGGAVIPCDYFIKCSQCMVQFVKDTLQSDVNQMKEKDAMSIPWKSKLNWLTLSRLFLSVLFFFSFKRRHFIFVLKIKRVFTQV